MSKKILAIIMATMMSISFVGCGSRDTTEKEETSVSVEITDDMLSGEWAEDLTLTEFNNKFDNLLKSVKETTKNYGLEYTEGEVAKDGNKKYLTYNNDNAEKNRLQSLNFGRTIYGDDLSSGQIVMKVLFNFDGEAAIKNKEVKLSNTSLAKYSEVFTGEKDRNFSEISKGILDILNSEDGEGVYKNQINGLYEEFIVCKDYIVYRIQTKTFKFKTVSEQ